MGQTEDSILQVCQVKELKQTKSGKGTQSHAGVSMRHFCQKTWESTVENGQQAKRSQRSSFRKTWSQDFTVHTDGLVTNDQSGWGFSVKQGATTVREDSAAYTVSNSTLTMEVEAVTLALRWIALRGDSRTTYAIIFTDSVSLLQIV